MQFDNGEVKESTLPILRVERRTASMPYDVPLPSVQDAVQTEQSTLDDVNVENQDKDGHLPRG